MREIKFRAWSKKEKYMYYLAKMDMESEYENLVFSATNDYWSLPDTPEKYKNQKHFAVYELSNYVLMQYTGLKDKNGKEIYEGDIIEIPAYSAGRLDKSDVFIVNFGEYDNKEEFDFNICGYGFYLKWIGGINEFECEHLNSEVYRDRVSIIGNIYENPELMK